MTAVVPEVTITGLTAPFGDSFNSGTKLSTYEIRDTYSLVQGSHTIRFGVEARRILQGTLAGSANAGSYTFTSVLNLINDTPFRQTITVNPIPVSRLDFRAIFICRRSDFLARMIGK